MVLENTMKTFKDPALEKRFKKYGFVKLKYKDPEKVIQSIKLLNPDDKFLCNQQTSIDMQSYHCTFFDTNMNYRRRILELISEFYKNFVDAFLEDHRIVQSNVFIKPPNSGLVIPHQNLTITDEDAFTSVSLWTPAVNTSEMNGTLQVVCGSHKNFIKYRSAEIPYPLSDFLLNEGNKYLESIDVNIGEVVVLDDSLIHTTPINKTKQERIALHSICLPKSAPLLFHKLNRLKEIEVHHVHEDFWQYHMPGTNVINNVVLKTLPYDEFAFNKKRFWKFLIYSRIKNYGMWGFLKSIVNPPFR